MLIHFQAGLRCSFECKVGEKGSLFSCLQGFSVCASSTNGMKIRTYLVDYSAPKYKYQQLDAGFAHPFDQKNAADSTVCLFMDSDEVRERRRRDSNSRRCGRETDT